MTNAQTIDARTRQPIRPTLAGTNIIPPSMIESNPIGSSPHASSRIESAPIDDGGIDLAHVKVTPRDRQVLNLLVQGCSNKEIAGQLQISPRTVKQHLRTLFLRAGIREGRKRVKLAIAMFAKAEFARADFAKTELAKAEFAKEEAQS